jgi:hypothetical protein
VSFSTARSNFHSAKTNSSDQPMRKLADGLLQLTEAIERELAQIKDLVETVKRRQ